jgi:hypothetical protein
MKILKLSADIPDPMPSLGLRSLTVAIIITVAASAFVDPEVAPVMDTYHATLKVLGGASAVVGSLYMTRAISLTLLRSDGTLAFRGAYVAAASLSGLGLAEALSAFRPANIGHALAVYCVLAVASGALWTRFYGRSV